MERANIQEQVRQLYRQDPRYGLDAYEFVIRAVRYAQTRCGRMDLAVPELLNGLRHHAWRAFGPAFSRVLASWNVQRGADLGEVVLRLRTHDLIEGMTNAQKEDFEAADLTRAFPEPVPSRDLLRQLCRLFFNPQQLGDLERHFVDDQLDLVWLESLELDGFIANDDPTMGQVGALHHLLEKTVPASSEGRFQDALRAFEAFAREAADWWPKPDLVLHDFLVELEPYCPDFAAIILKKTHLTPAPPVELWSHQVHGATEPPVMTAAKPSTVERIQVYVDRIWVDDFEATVGSPVADLEAMARQRPEVALRLQARRILRALAVEKNFQKQLRLTTVFSQTSVLSD